MSTRLASFGVAVALGYAGATVASAEEAGISRLYGGIHFHSAIVDGLEQGRCIGAYTNALKTRK